MDLFSTSLFSFNRNSPATSGYTDINIAKFQSLLQEGNLMIVDVRTSRETARGIIDDAIVIDYFASDFEQQITNLPIDKKYVLYCRSGQRSADGCKVMYKKGFSNLYNLKGGYKSWLRSN